MHVVNQDVNKKRLFPSQSSVPILQEFQYTVIPKFLVTDHIKKTAASVMVEEESFECCKACREVYWNSISKPSPVLWREITPHCQIKLIVPCCAGLFALCILPDSSIMLVCVTTADAKQIWKALESLDLSVLSGSHTCVCLSRGGCIDNGKLVIRIINDAKEDYWAEVLSCVVISCVFPMFSLHLYSW